MQVLLSLGVLLSSTFFAPAPNTNLAGLWENPDGLVVLLFQHSDGEYVGSILEPEPRWSSERSGKRKQLLFRGKTHGLALRGKFFPRLSPAEDARCPGFDSRTTEFELILQENGNLEGWFERFVVDANCKSQIAGRQPINFRRLRYQGEAQGECFTQSLSDPENRFEMNSRYGVGFDLSGHSARTSETRAVTMSIDADSSRGLARADFSYAWISQEPVTRSLECPRPNLGSVQAYLRALPPHKFARFLQQTSCSVLSSLVLSPDGPPLPPAPPIEPNEENLYGTPKILWVSAEIPIPGAKASIVGIFPPDGNLTVTGNGKPLDSYRFNQSRLSFVIPQDAREKIEIVVTREHEGRRYPSAPQKLLLFEDVEDAPGWVRSNLDSQIQGFLESWLFRESTRGLSRAIATFTTKMGRFRYPLFSAEADGPSEIKGCRWLVVIEGEFRNRYKDADFELLIALVPPGQTDAFVDNLDDTGLELIPVGKLKIRKDQNGQKTFEFEVTNLEFAEKLGLGKISFNQDEGSISLSKFFYCNLEKEGVSLTLHPKEKRIHLSVRKDQSLLSVSASEKEGITLNLSETETRIVNNRRHEYQRSFEEVNGDIGTSIRGTVRDRADPGAPILLSYRIGMDDRGRERGEGIPNVDADVTIHLYDAASHRIFGSVETKGSIRESQLDAASVRYRHQASGPIRQTEFGFAYQREQNEKSWKLDAKARGEIGEIDTEFGVFGSLEARTDRGIHVLNSIRAEGGVEAEFDVKKLGVKLRVGGEYKREFRPQQQETFRVFGSGTLAYKKVELILEGAYGNMRGNTQGEFSAGLDLGGIFKAAASLSGHENRVNLFKLD